MDEANQFDLSGEDLRIRYDATSLGGRPLLEYRDARGAQRFEGDQITITAGERTRLVAARLAPATNQEINLSLLLPCARVRPGQAADIAAAALIETVQGGIVPGGTGAGGAHGDVAVTYRAVSLRGTARAVMSAG
jgi:hypothetical protein